MSFQDEEVDEEDLKYQAEIYVKLEEELDSLYLAKHAQTQQIRDAEQIFLQPRFYVACTKLLMTKWQALDTYRLARPPIEVFNSLYSIIYFIKRRRSPSLQYLLLLSSIIN